jgi:hypothetical protein
MGKFEELKEMLNGFEKDFVKFYDKQNKSAGTRVRKHMNDLRRKAQEIRKEVQGMKAAAKATAGGTETPTPPPAPQQ